MRERERERERERDNDDELGMKSFMLLGTDKDISEYLLLY